MVSEESVVAGPPAPLSVVEAGVLCEVEPAVEELFESVVVVPSSVLLEVELESVLELESLLVDFEVRVEWVELEAEVEDATDVKVEVESLSMAVSVAQGGKVIKFRPHSKWQWLP